MSNKRQLLECCKDNQRAYWEVISAVGWVLLFHSYPDAGQSLKQTNEITDHNKQSTVDFRANILLILLFIFSSGKEGQDWK